MFRVESARGNFQGKLWSSRKLFIYLEATFFFGGKNLLSFYISLNVYNNRKRGFSYFKVEQNLSTVYIIYKFFLLKFDITVNILHFKKVKSFSKHFVLNEKKFHLTNNNFSIFSLFTSLSLHRLILESWLSVIFSYGIFCSN